MKILNYCLDVDFNVDYKKWGLGISVQRGYHLGTLKDDESETNDVNIALRGYFCTIQLLPLSIFISFWR